MRIIRAIAVLVSLALASRALAADVASGTAPLHAEAAVSLLDVQGEASTRVRSAAGLAARGVWRLALEHERRAYGSDSLASGSLALAGGLSVTATFGPGNDFLERGSLRAEHVAPLLDAAGLRFVPSFGLARRSFAQSDTLEATVATEIYGLPAIEFVYLRIGAVHQSGQWQPLALARLAFAAGPDARWLLTAAAGREVAGGTLLRTHAVALDWQPLATGRGVHCGAGVEFGRIASRETLGARISCRIEFDG